ncbi:hypothetical protein [Geminocystis herdmanii]|uniref:hypothetical protein n=1 Tax=Geminocystis herdmanii TaxID=669359 RepID=UPI001181B31B|nr:hypothetical protein [Geminocystis herdmanii]
MDFLVYLYKLSIMCSSDRILDNVKTFLALPQQINQTNQNLITANILDLETENMDKWLPFLWAFFCCEMGYSLTFQDNDN